jgi:hypothetical protein
MCADRCDALVRRVLQQRWKRFKCRRIENADADHLIGDKGEAPRSGIERYHALRPAGAIGDQKAEIDNGQRNAPDDREAEHRARCVGDRLDRQGTEDLTHPIER